LRNIFAVEIVIPGINKNSRVLSQQVKQDSNCQWRRKRLAGRSWTPPGFWNL